jgi:cobalt-zinc-cadmium resistance protein CzcA
MIEKLLDAAIRFRWGVVVVTLSLSRHSAPRSWSSCRSMRYPTSPTSRCRSTPSRPALGPLDMERLVTFPVETAMAGIPGLESSRSISRNGFSQVTVVFDEGVDLYFARQQVAERLNQAKESLPEGVEPQMGPMTTGLGEVLMYVVEFEPAGTSKNPKVAGNPDSSRMAVLPDHRR